MISPNVRYLDYVVKLLGLEGAKPVPTPGVASHRTAMSCSTPLTAEESAKYRSSVGALLYHALDREDVQYEVSCLGTCIKETTEAGMCALKRVVRYLLGTKNAAIRFEIRGRSDRAVIAGWAVTGLVTCQREGARVRVTLRLTGVQYPDSHEDSQL